MPDEKREIRTLDDAFACLEPEVQAHCKRVARYAEIVFTYADSHYVYLDAPRAESELKIENIPLIAAAGMYHEIAKAYGETEYGEMDSASVFEELCAADKRYKVSDRRFIQMAIADQNEWMNGNGYPNKKTGDDIPYASRILALVNDLDEISMKLVSEYPIEDALLEMKKHVPDKYDPEFYKAMKSCKGKLGKVFNSARKESRAVPAVEPILKRRVTRPMELVYRPVCNTAGELFAREASMRFRGNKENTLTYEEVKHIIAKQELGEDMSNYFVLEACDMIRRLDACRIANAWIGLEVLPVFYNKKKLSELIRQFVDASEVDPSKIRFMISATGLKRPTKVLSENIKKCSKIGISFILTDVTREFLEQTPMTWEEYPFAGIRFASECLLDQSMHTSESYLNWEAKGIEILVDGVESSGILETIVENGSITGYTGIHAGIYEKEDDIIKRELRLSSL